MADVREKLVEIIQGSVGGCSSYWAGVIADGLIANGVTIQRWIPVTERLPERGQEVIVYSGGVLEPTVFSYQFWNKNYDSWARITHWMPLPEAPVERKGGEVSAE